MPAIEAWLLGGPADGRITPIEFDASGQLPAMLVLPQTGVYIGADDQPSPAVQHRYVLASTDELPI
ncbi:hypothetical protein [Micromonospora sp. NPDC051006]|uniref:hypothetical protein n=1 Tax=Micromonospora sp. NPDC051006 TaxID=3364283 RepID=UPI00379F19AF